MKRPLSHFENLETFVDFSYGNFGNSLQKFQLAYTPGDISSLGYCYKFKGANVNFYYVYHTPIGIPHTDRRIVAHELGHITLGHLDGIHEELDGRVLYTIQKDRQNLIKGINETCGIDYADRLLTRVIDDPRLNHSLHNIAMDFEVNSKILSPEDIEEMENDITSILIRDNPSLRALSEMKGNIEEQIASGSIDEEKKKALEEAQKQLDEMLASTKVKFMIPGRYKFKDGTPFPSDATYAEYLILIIKNIDQFVKMLISINNGGSGDTSEVSNEQLQEAMQGGMQSLDDLMQGAGMGEGQGNSGHKYKGERSSDGSSGKDDNNQEEDGQGRGNDHGSDSRKEADKKRKEGKIRSRGGSGVGDDGNASGVLDNEETKDTVELAIEDVMRNYRKKVVKYSLKKDLTYLYNRGINRTVISPVYHNKVKLVAQPKIVFLIDVSGSMNTELVNRILNSISRKMKGIRKGLSYDIITWNTRKQDHYKDIDPKGKPPTIHVGGGTRMAEGIKYFGKNYDKDCILVLISDFEDYLDEWETVSNSMSGYELYGFNYGYSECTRKFPNMKVKNFQER